MRIEAFERDKEDGFQPRLAKRSKLPVGEQGRAKVHGSDAPSVHTTIWSEVGGSIRDSSVALSIIGGSLEASEPCSLNVSGSQPQEDGTVEASLPKPSPLLECQWRRMTGCRKVFPVSDSKKLIAHTKKHFVLKEGRRGLTNTPISPPTSNSCTFCDVMFQADNGDLSWSNMMAHVIMHYRVGHRLAYARIDWRLVEYLWEKGLLTRAQYRELKSMMNAQDVPSPPGLWLSDDESPSPIASVEEKRHREGQ